MNDFSIRDVENLTGIKAHTLRIWEQRYSFMRTKRKESKHRYYDNEDLKYLLRIAYLYNKGIKISHIACLGQEEIRQHALQLTRRDENHGIFINQLTEAAIDFDQPAFQRILHHVVLHLGFEKSVQQIMFPLLNRIGLLWLAGDIRPAQEHFASSMIIRQLLIAIDGAEPVSVSSKRNVLIFSPEGEFHEIPLLFMKYLMKKNGIRHVFVGKNTSVETLKEYCSVNNITELYMHIITNLLHCDINQYLQNLVKSFPRQKIFMSGASLVTGQVTERGVTLLYSSDEMFEFGTSH
ncbi:MAG TPA: MerR family transcriptional regulator [Flavitalea sp.]|nr:MerR family transcriptional regulator [Flavitalea sp.]